MHQLDHAWRTSDGRHHVRCVCGAEWTRERLADAAVALERHEHENPYRYDPANEGRAERPRRAA